MGSPYGHELRTGFCNKGTRPLRWLIHQPMRGCEGVLNPRGENFFPGLYELSFSVRWVRTVTRRTHAYSLYGVDMDIHKDRPCLETMHAHDWDDASPGICCASPSFFSPSQPNCKGKPQSIVMHVCMHMFFETAWMKDCHRGVHILCPEGRGSKAYMLLGN